ncbi:hypothetical protein ACP70R_012053 [Stipagrostis hirtigluma subsp. patula]
MRPSVLLLIVVAVGTTMVDGHPAANTPAAQFWAKALPGTQMPEAIADLVQKGVDKWPLMEHNSASHRSCAQIYHTICPLSMLAESGLFFHEEQLRPGSTMTVSLPAEAEAAILPHDVGEKVPFDNLDDVLTTFSIPAGSKEAEQVADTLRSCRAPPLAGELKSCTRSLESTVQSAMDMLGTTAGVLAATSVLPPTGLPHQPYEVQEVTKITGRGYVACHKVPFPYSVYYCHMDVARGYRAYVVSLRGLSGGPAADMMVICHHNTSNWNPAHPAFEILRTHPGGAPVCHFIPNGNLVFIRKTTNA